MSKGGKGGSADAAIAAQQQAEAARQKQITEGTASINSKFDSQFTPDYFDKLKQNYLDFAQPQLDKQYADTQKKLTFNLARNGNMDSSAAGTQFADLLSQYQANSQKLANDALSQANTAKNAVENSRASLISQLNTTGDQTAAANSAATQAQLLAQPAAYSPLGDMFSATTSALATQAQLEKQAALTGAQPTYNTGLFGTK